jgi:hypothetical protein
MYVIFSQQVTTYFMSACYLVFKSKLLANYLGKHAVGQTRCSMAMYRPPLMIWLSKAPLNHRLVV